MRAFGVALLGLCAVAAGGPARAACTLTRLAELPVTMRGLQPMVDARVNGKPARFLADSGAFYSLLSPAAAAELNVSRIATFGFSIRGVGGSADADIATVKTLEIGGVTFPPLQFVVGGSSVGDAAGVLGQNFLGFRDAEYDLAHGAIRLIQSRDCSGLEPAYWANNKPVAVVTMEPRTQEEPHVYGSIVLNGQKVRALFDTGADTSAVSLATATRLGIRIDGPDVQATGRASGIGGGLVRSWIAPFASIAIGDEQIRNLRLQIIDAPMVGADMILGADFFLSHRVYIANGMHRIFLTYNGGPVFDLRAAAARGAPAPVAGDGTPEALARQAAALVAQRRAPEALALLDRAVTAKPDDPAIRGQRGRLRLGLGHNKAALDDLDAAVRAAPADPELRLDRARARLRTDDKAGAQADADAVASAAAPSAMLRQRLGGLYQALDDLPAAAREYDRWLATHPNDSMRVAALNGSCWTRALMGRELATALRDCDAALRLAPGDGDLLDSRGLVYLRLDQPDRALADYDAALKHDPKLAWSLYGRGLVKRKRGDTAGADADIKAAIALDPKIEADLRHRGLLPAN